MTFDHFCQSIDNGQPPANLSAPLTALWHEAQGDWDAAHDYAQRNNDSESAWVHAYLHRKEGDLANAGYWYARAGRTTPEDRLEKEWEFITKTLLEKMN